MKKEFKSFIPIKLEKKIETKIKQLEKIELLFKSLCHHKNCKYIMKCPTHSKKCKRNLNYFTGILWKLSMDCSYIQYVLSKLIRNYRNIDRQQCFPLEETFEDLIFKLVINFKIFRKRFYLVFSGTSLHEEYFIYPVSPSGYFIFIDDELRIIDRFFEDNLLKRLNMSFDKVKFYNDTFEILNRFNSD